jgi:hypothetical protein
MSIRIVLAAIAVAGMAGACQTIPKEMTVGQYCADARHANKDVCKINVEIDGQKKALADTNLKLSEGLALARDATARAQATADAAMARQDQMFCETRKLSRTNVGSCSPGYTLVSCTQTRFTYRAGAPSIMRSIDDQQCRFQDRVLEMQVRCCMAGSAAAPTETASSPSAPVKATPQPTS